MSLALAEHALPVRAAVARAEYAAFRIGAVRMAECGDEDGVRDRRGSTRMRADLLAVGEADLRPASCRRRASVYMPSPCAMSERMSASPVPT